MKKFLSLLLAVIMVISVIPLTGITAFATTSGDFEYELLKDGTASITGYIGSSKIVNIPQMIDGCTVTEIGQFAFVELNITEINMPDSVLTIANSAIYGCSQLKDIKFSKNLYAFELGAIAECVNLHSVTLPKTVKQIDETALGYAWGEGSKPNLNPINNFTIYGHSGTTAQTYAENNGFIFVDISSTDTAEPPFIWKCTKDTNTSVSIVGYIGELDTNVILPEKILGYAVTGIGKFVFDGCTALTEIWIPNSVRSLGNGLFNDCENLATVVIGNGVTELSEDTFRNCWKLERVVLSASVANIPRKTLIYGKSGAVIYGYKDTAAEKYTNTGDGNGYKFYILPEITDTNDINLYYSLGETTVEEVVFAMYINRDIDINSVSVKDRNGDPITDFQQAVTPGAEFSANLVNGQKFSYKFSDIILGDVNDDGIVDAADAVMIQRYDAGIITLTSEQLSVGDVNGDGIVDAADAVKIQRYDAGLIDTL